MAFENVLGELQIQEDTSANKILDSLLNPKNIDMKTHIISPITFAIMEGIINNIEGLLSSIKKLKLPMYKKVLREVVKKLKQFMVSWNRMSRDEITKTLQSIRQEGATERSFFQKMLGTGKQ